jgi:hypothetical protein
LCRYNGFSSKTLCSKITAYFLSKGLKMITFGGYMAFFDKWLNNQFPHVDHAAQNREILQVVGELVTDADDLQYWANRDCWSMYNYAKELA